MQTRKINLPEWLTASVAFVYYIIMALWKLNQTPIWQDEAMEFYCSIPVKGAIKGITEYTTMYERMAYIQQQPPLYNWLMCLWLQVNEGEWWFRFSSVVFGFIAVVGLYLIIRKLYSKNAAAFSVIVFSSIYILQYYIKEASEYSLLIMLMFWLIYLYIGIIEKITVKKVLMFTVLCVVNVYTHYGAAFVVVPMALSLLVYYYRENDLKTLKTAFISYIVAALGAGVPMLLLYVVPQSTNAVSTIGVNKEIEITGNNIILDFFDSIMWVLRWCMLDYDRDAEIFTPLMWVLVFVLIILGIIVYRKTSCKAVRYLLAVNVGMYFIYYVVTTLNFYAYGWFGNRYNLFLFSLWYTLIFVIVYECLMLLKKSSKDTLRRLSPVIMSVTIAIAVLFSVYGVKRINDHWWKMDLKEVVKQWYDNDGEDISTFVNYHQRYAFVYYLTHYDEYTEDTWNNIWCNENLESLDYNDEEWIEYLQDEVYTDGIPDTIYIVSGQKDSVIVALEDYGYNVEPIVDGTAKLFLLTALN
jgi:uncharacterized membrane protein